jgi:Tol biopolymer transport system component
MYPSDAAGNGRRYLRQYDTVREVATRLTDFGSEEAPAWSSDGKKLVYVSRVGQTYSIYQMALDRADPPVVLWKGPRVRQVDYTLPDSSYSPNLAAVVRV